MNQVRAFPDAVLVAIDFCACSLRALDTALGWRGPKSEITLLHVLDSELARSMESTGLCTYDEVMKSMRRRAEEELARLRAEKGTERLETMVVEGIPFVEIVKVANDLELDLIVIGSHSSESRLEQLLFGGNAEKVLRGASKPVLCVP